MPWARLDDGFHDHPKVDGLSLAAVGLYTLCLTWAHRHRRTAVVPGHVTEARVRKLAGRQSETLAAELLSTGLWEAEAHLGGYVIHDFADYLPKERDPAERREAGRKGAAKRWQGDGKLPDTSMANDGSRASAPAYPSRPDPTQDVTHLEGERPEPLRAVTATDPLEGETCTRHPNGNLKDEPCRGCQRVEEHRRRRVERETEQARRATERAALDCVACDGVWVLDENKRPTGRKCDHRRAS